MFRPRKNIALSLKISAGFGQSGKSFTECRVVSFLMVQISQIGPDGVLLFL